MTDRLHFHFSLGPVQDFVAQARRTRDFWAGSFLLSYLSGVAMETVGHLGGKLVFPLLDEDISAWLTTGKPRPGAESDDPPRQGRIPNRFLAEVPADFEPVMIDAAVFKAWKAIADQVWANDFSWLNNHLDQHPKTKTIWDRQVEGFWQIIWAMTDPAEGQGVLESRKCWRAESTTPEPGVKCMLMHGWQELSGSCDPNVNKGTLPKFWHDHRGSDQTANLPEKIKTDFEEGEYLCAIAYIKRRFSHYFANLRVPQMPGNWTLHGWNLPVSVPSTHYIGAVPWMADVLNAGLVKEVDDFQAKARKLAEKLSEYETWEDFEILKNGLKNKGTWAKNFTSLNGILFHEFNLDNPRLFPEARRKAYAGQVAESLRQLKSALLKANPKVPNSPSVFYAALFMDGDNLGRNLVTNCSEKKERISQAILEFTQLVEETVRNHNGFPIFAGGDDVVAFLPVIHALPCALALRTLYTDVFAKLPTTDEVCTTLSGAIVFAQTKVPLGAIYRQGHDLLDRVAKEGRGRDAIAVCLRQPGGEKRTWAMPWEATLGKGLKGDPIDSEPIDGLSRLAEGLESGGFSNRFLFQVGEWFRRVSDDGLTSTGDQTGIRQPTSEDEGWLSKEDLSAMLVADLVKIREAEQSDSDPEQDPDEVKRKEREDAKRKRREDAKRLVDDLIAQCRPIHRKTLEGGQPCPMGEWDKRWGYEHDGALLARFLAKKGVMV